MGLILDKAYSQATGTLLAVFAARIGGCTGGGRRAGIVVVEIRVSAMEIWSARVCGNECGAAILLPRMLLWWWRRKPKMDSEVGNFEANIRMACNNTGKR